VTAAARRETVCLLGSPIELDLRFEKAAVDQRVDGTVSLVRCVEDPEHMVGGIVDGF
jgi:hypothetical protein